MFSTQSESTVEQQGVCSAVWDLLAGVRGRGRVVFVVLHSLVMYELRWISGLALIHVC